jgi:hypothetical protein
VGGVIIPKEEYDDIRLKLEKDICVLIFTYSNHNKRLIQVLDKLNEIDIYKIVSFNHNYIPPKKSHTMADVVLSTHRTLTNVNFPWFWHMKYTTALARELNFKYAFLICGDTYVGLPEKIFNLPTILKEDDLLSYAHSPKAIGTFAWFARVSALRKITEWFDNNWDGPGSSVGVKLRRAVNETDLKLKHFMGHESHPFFKVKLESEKGILIDYLQIKHLYGGVEP